MEHRRETRGGAPDRGGCPGVLRCPGDGSADTGHRPVQDCESAGGGHGDGEHRDQGQDAVDVVVPDAAPVVAQAGVPGRGHEHIEPHEEGPGRDDPARGVAQQSSRAQEHHDDQGPGKVRGVGVDGGQCLAQCLGLRGVRLPRGCGLAGARGEPDLLQDQDLCDEPGSAGGLEPPGAAAPQTPPPHREHHDPQQGQPHDHGGGVGESHGSGDSQDCDPQPGLRACTGFF